MFLLDDLKSHLTSISTPSLSPRKISSSVEEASECRKHSSLQLVYSILFMAACVPMGKSYNHLEPIFFLLKIRNACTTFSRL